MPLSATPLAPLARLTVTVLCEMGDEARTLLLHLRRTRASVLHLWPAPEKIGEGADLIFCEYGPGLAKRLAWVPGEPQAALVVLLPQFGHVDLHELEAARPDAVLHRPYIGQAIDVALVLALDHFNFGKRSRLRIQRMEENIHAVRDIERAKRVIMASKQVGEAEAFRVLRGMAMERRVTVAAIAAKLVDSVDVPI